ncbi:MAG: hypothetical protein KatS3mg076_3245 [Candidatus Binatia bacterium]|nr:MAG: hypothetical protein KatS3mg076_3245 [Candidatus Binatia bacterium]
MRRGVGGLGFRSACLPGRTRGFGCFFSFLRGGGRRIALCLLAGFSLFALGLFCTRPAYAAEKPPHVFIFLVDALRPDHLGAYGYPRKTSENLDALAQESLVFTDVRSVSSWTLPAVGTLFTSQYPTAHGLRANNGQRWVRSLRAGAVTLAELFLAADYYTISISANDWLKLEQKTRLERGFVVYEVLGPVTAERLNERARAQIEKQQAGPGTRDRPLFVYLHYMETHLPWYAPRVDPAVLGPLDFVPDRPFTEKEAEARKNWLEPAPFREERWKQARHLRDFVHAYDETIYAWDRAFGAFLGWLREKGLYENAVVTVVADHGEELWDHGTFGHGFSLFEEAVRVPWIVRYPRGRPRGRIGGPASLLDFAPTILRAAGLPVPPAMKGVDASKGVPSRDLFAEVDACRGDWGSCRQRAGWRGQKKILDQAGRVVSFDLEKDPGEKNPLPPFPELEAALLRWEKEQVAIARELGESVTGQIDPSIHERLRMLGYE